MDLSIVISVYNEEESLKELVSWIDNTFKNSKYKYEIIIVDDGSTDNSWSVICELSESYPINAISFRRNYGKSAALYCGFELAQGKYIATMDADLQDSPQEIPEMISILEKDGLDLISGWKKKRHDGLFTKNIPSKIYNRTARWVTKIKLHDMNCGLKVYRKEVVKNIEVYGEMHRYIPYLSKNAGFSKIGEKAVIHQARKYGKSKFGANRFINGFLDLLSLWFLSRFGKKPMHFFGLIGSLTFLFGGGTSLYLIIDKVITQSQGLKYRPVTDQPLFYIALTTIIIGMQLFLSGFIAELISRNSGERNVYKIKNRISNKF